MIRQKMDSLSSELLSRMAHMMTRMTHWLDSHDSLARWLAVCQDPSETLCLCLVFVFASQTQTVLRTGKEMPLVSSVGKLPIY